MNQYSKPFGYEGVGADILFCPRINGRKKCNLCFRYAFFEVWSKEWRWFYLLKWRDYYYFEEFAHFRHYFKSRHKIVPTKYQNTGLHDYELKSLLKKGCKHNKKCICMNVVQRAFWYCPDCYMVIKALADLRRQHSHDIMLTERDELKAEILILRLSGSINF